MNDSDYKFSGFLRPIKKRLKTFLAIKYLEKDNPYHHMYAKITKVRPSGQVFEILQHLPEEDRIQLRKFLEIPKFENPEVKKTPIENTKYKSNTISFHGNHWCTVRGEYCESKNKAYRKCTNTQFRLACPRKNSIL